MIRIGDEAWQVMRAHAEAVYPNECCGAMLGRNDGDTKHVTAALPLDNVHAGPRMTRYELRPEDLLRADKVARGRGLDLIGIFHSHPDHDAYFSETDLKNSCPWYSFVVVSVKAGRFDHAKSFLPNMEQTEAPEEALELLS
ncbi:MAG: M67 family metallopeptidase [Bryobacterales bacterium]|nr:M67 family metallopeptidase [Bryobacterales bacterium]